LKGIYQGSLRTPSWCYVEANDTTPRANPFHRNRSRSNYTVGEKTHIFIRGTEWVSVDLGGLVKYVNLIYSGLMIGLAAYSIYLIVNQYDFAASSPSGPIDLNSLINSANPIATVLIVMVISTVSVVFINMYYENSMRIRVEKRVEKRASKTRTTRRNKR